MLSLLQVVERPDQTSRLRVSEVISALSFALDLTEGQPFGHAIRSCVIGMHLATEIGVPQDSLGALYYALLMKDAGCSSNASRMMQILGSDDIQAKRDVRTTDWTRIGWESLQYAFAHVRPEAPFLTRMQAMLQVALQQKKNAREVVQIRCERGAAIARKLGLPELTATAIHSLDELWNGTGQPEGLRGEEIPLFSRILNIAQTIDVFFTSHGSNFEAIGAVTDVVCKRSGKWFDPDLVKAFCAVAGRDTFWLDLLNAEHRVALSH